jgi:hypothetical protein
MTRNPAAPQTEKPPDRLRAGGHRTAGATSTGRHQPWWNALCIQLLQWPVRFGLDAHLCVLRFRGRRTGRVVTLPVGYSARCEHSLVVRVGRAEEKSWWRNFSDEHPVDVLLRGQWRHGLGRIVDQQTSTVGTTVVDVVIDIAVSGRERQESDRRWLKAWVGSVTAGELAGFCAPLLAIAVVAQQPDTVLVPTVVSAGAVEGALLGWSQARVLQRRCRRLSVTRWTGLTTLAAAARR